MTSATDFFESQWPAVAAAMSFPTSSSNASSLCFRLWRDVAARSKITGKLSMASSGCYARELRGGTFRAATASGRPPDATDSADGPETERSMTGSPEHSQGEPRAPKAVSTGTSSTLTERRFRPAARLLAVPTTIKRDRSQREDQAVSPALGYGHGGFSTKIHLVTDGKGLPLAALLSAGQRHESAFFQGAMNAIRVPQPVGRLRKRPEAVAGDRGYDSGENRRWCHRKNIESVIPVRKGLRSGPGRPPTCDEKKYERRNPVVERCVGHLKECRRVATRYEKKASHYEAMVRWAFVGQYLKR